MATTQDDGAKPHEIIFEACRRNNTSLLEELLQSTKPLPGTKKTGDEALEEAIAELVNGARDPLGNAALHVAAAAGSYDVLDVLLDQPLVETDPRTRTSASTPLHSAVEFANALDPSERSGEGMAVVEILVDAGCDPRIRDKSKRKPIECVDPRNEELVKFLRRAEMLLVEGEAVVNEDEDEDEEVDGKGSASDSE